MAYYLQDPGNPETTYLIEVLLEECQRATGGAASFAWATSRGINLLLENEHFVHFLRQYTFDLVIGVDAVTDVRALQSLSRVQAQLSNLNVSVFLNNYAGSMFHPKACWFRRKSEGALVVGSGNLTEGGLSRNWEAFSVTQLDGEQLSDIEVQWNNWKSSYKDDLLSPTNAAVMTRAGLNTTVPSTRSAGLPAAPVGERKRTVAKRLPRNRYVGAPAALSKAKPAKPVTPAGAPARTKPIVTVIEDVLIAEIPRGSSRWNQANFDLYNYENFFGAKVGTTRYMFFRHVNLDGTLDDTETRPSVAVKSSNWRFELAAAAGKRYPATGRPVAVFLRQASRNFLYRLLMPDDRDYPTVERILAAHSRGPMGRVRRVRLAISTLEQTWPNSPFWKVSDPEPPEA